MITEIAVTAAAGTIINMTPPAVDINRNITDTTEIKSHICEAFLK